MVPIRVDVMSDSAGDTVKGEWSLWHR